MIRLKGEPVPMDPRSWDADFDVSVNVGLGAGSKDNDMALLQQIALKQEQILLNMGPANPLVTLDQYRNTLAKMVEVGGVRSPELYFQEVEPEAVQAYMEQMANKPDPKIQELQMKAQMDERKTQIDAEFKTQELQLKAQMEQVQAQADIATQQRKTEAEIALAERKFELERELKLIEMQIRRETAQVDLQMKQADHQLRQHDMATTHSFKEKEMDMKASAEGLKKHKSEKGDEYLSKEEERAKRQDMMFQNLAAIIENSSKRRKGVKIVRGADGRPSHAEDIYD
jgi:hypothetical protein